MTNLSLGLAGLPAAFRRVSATRPSGNRRPRVSNRRPFGLDSTDAAVGIQLRAAQYVRMSTDHQRYSTSHQKDAIAAYAAARGIEIVRTYADEGKSGLSIEGRKGLSQLLEDVVARRTDFGIVLVFDVSRWGRFQDADESACYEFICRCAGLRVEYCAEPFINDGSPITTVIKSLKRVMAGEYSRELSHKIWFAKCRLTRMGFHQGGPAPFALRRMVVDAAGRPGEVLEYGQHKYRQEDRVVLVPGPRHEVECLRWVYEQVGRHGVMPTVIASALTARRIVRPGGRPWTDDRVQQLLTNEKYIGRLTYNRTSMKLKAPMSLNPRDTWVVVDDAIPALIPRPLFDRVQSVMASWSTRIDNETALKKLTALFKRRGYLTQRLIDATRGMPNSHFYDNRFGGLVNAYRLVGFSPKRDFAYLSGNLVRVHRVAALREEVASALRSRGIEVQPSSRTAFTLNDTVRAAVMLGLCRVRDGVPTWQIQVQLDRRLDWIVIARLAPNNEDIQDYWLVRGGVSFVAIGVKHRKVRERRCFQQLPPLLDALCGLVVAGDSAIAKDAPMPRVQNCRFRDSR